MLWAGCVGWCVAVASSFLHGQRIVAHVLDVKGEWRVDGSAGLVTAGQGLVAGAKVMAGSNRPGDAITLVRDEDLTRQPVVCDASPANPCRTQIVVQGVTAATVSGGSQLRGLVQAAISVLLNRPPAIASHYALTLTRGKESVRESEAVVALDPGQGVVLPPAPADTPAGHYRVTIVRAGEKAGAGTAGGADVGGDVAAVAVADSWTI